jgi:aminoglycoside phosphotransferase (APT) family kinase protein
MNEIEAVKIANEQSIPTPQVSQFETTFGRLAMVASRAVGNCTEVASAQTYHIDTILAIIQKLHTLKKPKFGFALEDRTVTSTLPESQVAYVGDIYSYCIGKLGLDPTACRFDELMLDCQSNSEYVFSHRDLKPQHVFLKAGQLSSVIDWEQAVFIDPIIDYSIVHAHLLANGRDDLASLVGAQAASLFDMNRYRLHVGRELILIAAFVSENKTERLGIVNIAQEYFSLGKNIGGLLVR